MGKCILLLFQGWEILNLASIFSGTFLIALQSNFADSLTASDRYTHIREAGQKAFKTIENVLFLRFAAHKEVP